MSTAAGSTTRTKALGRTVVHGSHAEAVRADLASLKRVLEAG